jgi:hypothetical protein
MQRRDPGSRLEVTMIAFVPREPNDSSRLMAIK